MPVIQSKPALKVSPPRQAAASPVAPPPAPAPARASSSASAARKPRPVARRFRGGAKLANKELPSFSRQMAAMLTAGMPIISALEAVEEQASNPQFKLVISEIRRHIESGLSFSESISQIPEVFDDLYVNMTRAGERSGQFAETMRRTALLLENNMRLKRKVKSAMTYPMVVMSLALIIASGMILFIVPVFSSMYSDFGKKLPGPTQFLVDLSNGAKRYSPIIVPAIIALVWGFRRWKKTAAGAFAMDSFYLRAPVFGVLAQKVAISRLARTLAQMLSSGVPILGSLEIVSKACGNLVVGKAVMRAHGIVERGDTLSSAMENQPAIPSMLVRMLAAGEKTGKVDEMMVNIADTYDDEIETMLASLTSLMEPLLMIFLGVIIGSIVVCMFMPIFKMSEAVNM
ncbi:MAG: type II secretion system F family protein [bacterium]